jgi:hypothetical protein
LQIQKFRRFHRIHFDQTPDVDRAVLVDKRVDENSKLRFEADNSKRRLIELDFFLESGVRCVIRAQNGQGTIRDSLNDRIDVGFGP